MNIAIDSANPTTTGFDDGLRFPGLGHRDRIEAQTLLHRPDGVRRQFESG